jgi:inner membrane protein
LGDILKARQHMGMALVIGIGLFHNDVMGFVYTPLMMVGSLLPDIDTPFSKLGKYNIFAAMMRHRGFMHSLLTSGIIAVAGTLINPVVGVWVSVGYLSHLFADSLTPSGIRWLYPFKNSTRQFK